MRISSGSWARNVPLTVVLSILLATALDRVTKARTFFRVSYYVPYVTASVAVVALYVVLLIVGPPGGR